MPAKRIRKIQRQINRAVRKLNESICADNLWRGRFVVHQVDRAYQQFFDRSGYDFYVFLQFLDKKTGQNKTIPFEYFSFCFAGHLGWAMNNFIVQDCDVWKKEDPIHDKKVDFTPDRRWS